jgi:histidinol dehydrogenase
MTVPILRLDAAGDVAKAEALLANLRLDPRALALGGIGAREGAAVATILNKVAEGGDKAIVEISRQFDDPQFSAEQIRVTAAEMTAAAGRVEPGLMAALRRAIAQVREYQSVIMPKSPATLRRPGVELGLRFTPIDRVGLYVPGGKASYPSSLIMLAVPAQVAGVREIVVCSPPSKFGKSDLVLAACAELGLTEVFRAGGAAAIAAMAFGTATIPAVDKIVGPGNRWVQMAKRAVAGAVGVDGFLGPSEILILADDSGDPACIAADMIAQAEHDPGSAFLLTDSEKLAISVSAELAKQSAGALRGEAIAGALADQSAILVDSSMDRLIDWANRFAAEHVNIQVRDEQGVLGKLRNAGAIFVGKYSPVAAGDYVAGPSHCLPTNTTARFSSGISVYEFLKRSSVVRYDPSGLSADADAIVALAEAEGLPAHAASVRIRHN